MSRHLHTDAQPADIEHQAIAGAHAKLKLWDLSVDTPKWAPRPAPLPRAPPAAVLELELQNAKALWRLRKLLATESRKGGITAKLRPLTFERWRFAALQQEGSMAPSAHPVLPSSLLCPP